MVPFALLSVSCGSRRPEHVASSEKYLVPKLCFHQQEDRVRADFCRYRREDPHTLQSNPVVMTYPIGRPTPSAGWSISCHAGRSILMKGAQRRVNHGEIPVTCARCAKAGPSGAVEQARARMTICWRSISTMGCSPMRHPQGIRKGCLAACLGRSTGTPSNKGTATAER